MVDGEPRPRTARKRQAILDAAAALDSCADDGVRVFLAAHGSES